MATKSKQRGGSSVLSRQKPKSARQKRADLRRRWRLGGIALGLAGAFALSYWLMSRPEASTAAEGGPRGANAWQVTLKMDGEAPLATAAADDILAVVQKTLRSGSEANLRRAAQLAQQTEAFATVHLVRTGKRAVVVQIKPRQAVLCIEADKLRLVGADGAVYGSALAPETCPGPVLKGVFSAGKGRFSLASDMTLKLDKEEQATVREALDLVQLATAAQLTITTLDHRRYRGFTITLANRDLEVAIGRAPFAGKLHKLDEILGKLAEKGEQAMRVELDYQGKAFIKLKKM